MKWPLAARGMDFADTVGGLLGDPESYRKLALGAHADFKQRLNWRVAGNAVVELMKRIR